MLVNSKLRRNAYVTIWLLAIMTTVVAAFEAEKDGVKLRADVAANLYTWTITNASHSPITSFAIDVHHTYDFQGPDGWEIDGPMPAGEFRAWTDEFDLAIKPNESARCSVRVNSRGAILGIGTAKIKFAGGTEVLIADVWRPVPESVRTRVVVAVGISALAALHVLGGVVRSRRKSRRFNVS